MKRLKSFVVFVAVLITAGMCLTIFSTAAGSETDSVFSGNGTKKSPYLIENAEELKLLRDMVNDGNSFEGIYFRQTADIDLDSEEWVPIGEYTGKSYFYGIYDGDGHYIENLVTVKSGNNGLFGKLGGVVMNLGIESGDIYGNCIGAFTSHAAGSKAVIINCYNKATVHGSRGGGIADNFNGIILNCWTDCELLGKKNGDIYAYSCVKAINCYTNNGVKEEVSEATLNKGLLVSASKAEVDVNDLNTWTHEGGKVVFSENKYKFTFADFPQLILAYGTWIILGSITATAAAVLLFEFIHKNKKVQKNKS